LECDRGCIENVSRYESRANIDAGLGYMGGRVMAATAAIPSPLRELAHRENDGVEVVLFWHSVSSDLLVCVSDHRSGAYFELKAMPDVALDVFEHPYAYAAFCGVPYDDALLPSWALAARAKRSRNAEPMQSPMG
jgi:hypothetical protein